jgi:hypothetical protein
MYEKETNRSSCVGCSWRITGLGRSILPFIGVFGDGRSLNSGQFVAGRVVAVIIKLSRAIGWQQLPFPPYS